MCSVVLRRIYQGGKNARDISSSSKKNSTILYVVNFSFLRTQITKHIVLFRIIDVIF